MRKVQRVIAATALGLPLLLASQGMALASKHHGHNGSPHAKQDLQQSIKIAPVVVSGNDANVKIKPENTQSASVTNTNSNVEEGSGD